MAIYKGSWKVNEGNFSESSSSCVTGDIFGSCRCDCGPQLHSALKELKEKKRHFSLYESRR